LQYLLSKKCKQMALSTPENQAIDLKISQPYFGQIKADTQLGRNNE